MSDWDSLFEGLSPLEAQAFKQNQTLRAKDAISLAQGWRDAGDDQIDVATLAIMESTDWRELDFYFKAAMAGKGVGALSENEAAMVRLDRVLSWTAEDTGRLRELRGTFIDHCQTLSRARLPEAPNQTQLEIAGALERLGQTAEHLYDLTFLVDCDIKAERKTIVTLITGMKALQDLIRPQISHLKKTLD